MRGKDEEVLNCFSFSYWSVEWTEGRLIEVLQVVIVQVVLITRAREAAGGSRSGV